jgi:hypothetical protein
MRFITAGTTRTQRTQRGQRCWPRFRQSICPFSRWEKVARERRMRGGGVCRRTPQHDLCDGSRRRMRSAPHPQPPLPTERGLEQPHHPLHGGRDVGPGGVEVGGGAGVGVGDALTLAPRDVIQQQGEAGGGACRRQSARFCGSSARMWSKRVKSSAVTCRALRSDISIPFRRAAAIARGSGGRPMCQCPVPAESSLSASPCCRAACRNAPSASGERQILPRQMKRREGMGSILLIRSSPRTRGSSPLHRRGRGRPGQTMARTGL